MLNINLGHNQNLMDSCRKLYEYAFLIEQIRLGLAKGLKLEAAVDAAVDICVKEKILSDFLIRHRTEVKEMILSEYDEELHLKDTYNCGFADGKAAGLAEGLAKGRIESQNFALLTAQLINDSRINDLKRAADDESSPRTLSRKNKIKTE